jgi:hypothetical protein
LERRVPGETDLRIFTTEPIPAGGHRVRRGWPNPRVVRGGLDGRPRLRVVTLLVAVVLALAGCSGTASTSAGEGGQQSAGAAAAGDRRNLRGVCPATVVIQGAWFTQVEQFVAYQLLGRGYTVDAARKAVTGPLVSDGVDTGVKLQIRAGGPAIGFQQVSAQMYADRSITLGMIPLDEAIQNSKDQPVTGVMAPYDVDPLVLMWSPEKNPDWNDIADIGQTDKTVLFFNGERTYMDYLLGSGVLRQSQVDSSYDGSPSRFVAAGGDMAVQGFATSEPWRWEHEVKAWGKPLRYQLVADKGYPNYRNLLAIRSGKKAKLAPCLAKLVPMLQRATVAFMGDPEQTIKLTLDVVQATRQGYDDSEARARHAVEVMRRDELVTNGINHTIGDFDLREGVTDARVQKLIDIDTPIFAGQRKQLKPNLIAGDIATNEFLDPGIGLPADN